MNTSFKQDADFLNEVIGTGILESAIEWISKNMNPDDVFSEIDLCDWAEDNNYIHKDKIHEH